MKTEQIPETSPGQAFPRAKDTTSLILIIFLAILPIAANAQQFLPSTDDRHFIPTDSLSEAQHARAIKLAGLLMAPCCYSKTAAEDQSGQAFQVKMEARRGILAGFSDEEILQGFSRVYGERILARPTSIGFNKMVWIMPVVGLLIGAFIYFVFLRKQKGQASHVAQATPAKKKKIISRDDDPYLQRLEKELGDFEN